MKIQDFNTKEKNTWCPGCTNFGMLQAMKGALTDLVNQRKIKAKDIVMASGIGCHAKIFDYININGFYSLHGRVLPPCLGMKMANPELTVIGFGGDGDTYAEGISHFIHSCRYNVDMTMVVHNNKVFALTTGQATPTSREDFKGKSTPLGAKVKPLNPIAVALTGGATFVARGYTGELEHLKKVFKQAIEHKGFALVDVLQPCITFNNFDSYVGDHFYKLGRKHQKGSLEQALKKAKEWDYSMKERTKIPIGVFYQIKRPTFEDRWPQLKKPWHRVKRKIDAKKTIKEFI